MLNKELLTIDGSQGEGGGQILRTSLSLSMCLGVPIRIEKIRAGRKKPGLLRQHLTCVRAAKAICNAEVEGDELRSDQVVFNPGEISGGEYHFAIGTAGSTSLVFQTILPALLMSGDESKVNLSGGTHNMSAPSYEFLEKSFVNLLNQHGFKVNTKIYRYGFYPQGGGEWLAHISPSEYLSPIMLNRKTRLKTRKAKTLTSRLPEHISERELRQVVRKLNWYLNETEALQVDAFGPGNIVSLQLGHESHTEVFDEVARLGLKAERVAGNAIKRVKEFIGSKAVVGEYLADQLLLPMVLGAGGEYVVHQPSLHTTTNIEVINRFTNNAVVMAALENNHYKIKVKGLNLISKS